jgi:hypothetical protein
VAAKSDLLRYLTLYAQGGVYLDIKSTCRQSLDLAVRPEDRFLLMNWGLGGEHPELSHIAGGEYLQWAIVAVPGHPYLKEVIDRVLRNIDAYSPWRHGVGKRGTLCLTGPVPYTLAIESVRGRYPHTHLLSPDERGFVYSGITGGANHREAMGRSSHYTMLDLPIVQLPLHLTLVYEVRRWLKRVPLAPAVARAVRKSLRRKST